METLCNEERAVTERFEFYTAFGEPLFVEVTDSIVLKKVTSDGYVYFVAKKDNDTLEGWCHTKVHTIFRCTKPKYNT